jgi:hypothetical protein
MRRGLVVVALLTLVGCAHKPPPPPPPAPPPPPPPKGEVLRFKAKPGDEVKSKVKILIEQEQAAAQGDKRGSSKPMVLIFTFGEEEKVDAVSADGMLVTARLVDAEGHGSPGTSQAVLDDTALAFDELKIQFKRHPRGEVVSINLAGLRKPLAELTARQVLNAIYGAQRGQLFPEEHTDVGATWKTTMPIPSSSGFEGEVHYDYTYARKAGGLAVILCEGRFEGKRSPGGTVSQKLTGKSSAEYKFDIATGRLMASTVDQMTQDEGLVQGQQALQLGVRQHIRVEWAAVDKPEQ